MRLAWLILSDIPWMNGHQRLMLDRFDFSGKTNDCLGEAATPICSQERKSVPILADHLQKARANSAIENITQGA